MVTPVDSNSIKNEQPASISEWLSGNDKKITEGVVAFVEWTKDAESKFGNYLVEDGSFTKTAESVEDTAKNTYNGVKNYIADVRADEHPTRVLVDGLILVNSRYNSVAGSAEDTASAVGKGSVNAVKSIASWNGDLNLTKEAGYEFAGAAGAGIALAAIGAMAMTPAGGARKMLINASDLNAKEISTGATKADKKIITLPVITNISDEPLEFKTILKDGSVESSKVTIPPGGKGVIHDGKEVISQPKFDRNYNLERSMINNNDPLKQHADVALERAGVDPDKVEVTVAESQPRTDLYAVLPKDKDGNDIEFTIEQPSWGGTSQKGKSGDILVVNPDGSDPYINSRDGGTLGDFIDETGKPILDVIDNIKVVPLEMLERAAKIRSAK